MVKDPRKISESLTAISFTKISAYYKESVAFAEIGNKTNFYTSNWFEKA